MASLRSLNVPYVCLQCMRSLSYARSSAGLSPGAPFSTISRTQARQRTIPSRRVRRPTSTKPETKENVASRIADFVAKKLVSTLWTAKPKKPDPILNPFRPIPQTPDAYLKASAFYQQLNYYRDTTPPTAQQLSYAKDVFTKDVKPSFLFSTHKFREFPESDVPEVAFLGRSNVGKSSLLNVLFNRPNAPLAHTSSKPGRTRTMNAFGIGKSSLGGVMLKQKSGKEHAKIIGRGGLVVVDMPGYGQGSRQEWGVEIVKYLCQRKQLRRAFLLIDASHGMKPADWQILDIMRRNSVPHQIILAKADKIVEPPSKLLSFPLEEGGKGSPTYKGLQEIRQISEQILADIRPEGQQGVSALGEILACSSEKVMFRRERMGIDGIRWAVLQATGREADKRGLPMDLGLAVSGEKKETPLIRKFQLDHRKEAVRKVRHG